MFLNKMKKMGSPQGKDIETYESLTHEGVLVSAEKCGRQKKTGKKQSNNVETECDQDNGTWGQVGQQELR